MLNVLVKYNDGEYLISKEAYFRLKEGMAPVTKDITVIKGFYYSLSLYHNEDNYPCCHIIIWTEEEVTTQMSTWNNSLTMLFGRLV